MMNTMTSYQTVKRQYINNSIPLSPRMTILLYHTHMVLSTILSNNIAMKNILNNTLLLTKSVV